MNFGLFSCCCLLLFAFGCCYSAFRERGDNFFQLYFRSKLPETCCSRVIIHCWIGN